ncbi:hypothetical protein C8Q79DRAFT_751884 [Trametes meyenii]|nr:hypothetical protein C8Q79DRAFT_751884 [Trametes meyenii]
MLASHQALRNGTIFREILSHLGTSVDADQEDYYHAVKLLANIALVCKHFYRHAIPVLWRTMPGVVSALRVLPSFSDFVIEPAFEGRGQATRHEALTFVFTDEIEPNHWERFLSYAKHIHHIRLDDESEGLKVDPTVWTHLAFLARGTPIFPAMKTVCWGLYKGDDIDMGLIFLMAPSVRTIKITAEPWSVGNAMKKARFDVLFRTAFKIAPNVQHIEIASPEGPSDMDMFAIPGLLSRSLHTFHMGEGCPMEGNDTFLRRLAALPFLSQLIIAAKEDYFPPRLMTLRGFRALRTLEITFEEDTNDFLTIFTSSVLRDLRLSQKTWIGTQEVSKLFEVVAAHFSSLRVFEWKYTGLPDSLDRYEPESDFMDFIEPLFALRTLETLTLNVPTEEFTARLFHDDEFCSEEAIRTIAAGWPHIRTLELPPLPCPLSPPALLALAQGCPTLTTLRLHSVAFHGLTERSLVAYPVLDHGLRTLWIATPVTGTLFDEFDTSYSHAMPPYKYGRLWYETTPAESEACEVALVLLDRLFPNLDLGRTQCDNPTCWHSTFGCFGAVLSRLRSFRLVKKQDAQRLTETQ